MPPADAERAAGALLDVFPGGWSERRDHDRLEVVVWVPADVRSAAVAAATRALSSAGVTCAVAAEAEGEEWRDGLARHHRPIEVGGRLRVRPPWANPMDGFLDIVIDPGMAFGTGQHATTRGCLECLLDITPGSLIDVGCGSGVLAIAAVRLGHGPVLAVDNDPLCVEATARNARQNGVALETRLLDATAGALDAVDTVVANITRLHVIALAARVGASPPRTAILSGFRTEDAGVAVAPWLAAGMDVARQIDEDGWSALRLERT